MHKKRANPRLAKRQAKNFAAETVSAPAWLLEIQVRSKQVVLNLSDSLGAIPGISGSLADRAEALVSGKGYLSIEQYRLGERLQLDWDISAIPDDLPIPQLTLQPLPENALIYGIAPRIEGGVVRVEANYKRGVFRLCVSNPYDEVAQRLTSSGTLQALANIGPRIMALFGPLASLSVERRDGRHITCLRYPCARLTQEARAI